MTPIEAAMKAFHETQGAAPAIVEAACRAYVTALALDPETVERVATAIELCNAPYSSEHVALAALKSLTAKE